MVGRPAHHAGLTDVVGNYQHDESHAHVVEEKYKWLASLFMIWNFHPGSCRKPTEPRFPGENGVL
jgi:hypothetical protein